MKSKVHLPLDIIQRVCKILLHQECFNELESVLYNYPQICKQFNNFPTIVLVDSQQYDKYFKFIHTRNRPFGSKDLFIIKLEHGVPKSKPMYFSAKCHIVFGSDHNQNKVSKALKEMSYRNTVIENKSLINMMYSESSTYKCHDLLIKLEEENKLRNEKAYGDFFSDYTSNYKFCQVILMLKFFLDAVNPCLLRFESYFDNKDLSLEYEQLYHFYMKIIQIRFTCNFKELGKLPKKQKKDILVKPLKCSFEVIKDKEDLTSLYQCSILKNKIKSMEKLYFPRYFEKLSLNRKFCNWLLSSKLFETRECVFLNVKDAKIDKISSLEQENSENDFISIDCSNSATENTLAYYHFIPVRNHVTDGEVPRPKNKSEAEKVHNLSYDQLTDKAEIAHNTPVPKYYLIIFFKDFLAEELQSFDITAFNSNLETNYTEKEKYSQLLNTSVSIRGLELQINSLLDYIKRLRNSTKASTSQEEKISETSQKVMSTIVQNISSMEGLNKEQPFRLRAFHKNSHLVNKKDQIFYRKEWFRINLK